MKANKLKLTKNPNTQSQIHATSPKQTIIHKPEYNLSEIWLISMLHKQKNLSNT